MAFNIADMFEYAVDAVPDKVALVQDDRQLTYRELEERVNRLAHHLADAGIKAGDTIGIYGPNSIEWVEGMMAAAKLRAVPVNINYRYVEEELRYLFDNADLRAVVYQREYGPRIAAVRAACPTLHHLIVIDDGSDADLAGLDAVPYDEAVASGDRARDFEERSADDIWIIYTGGTTGMPKGVMWRQEDIFFSLAGGTDPVTRANVAHDHVHADAAGRTHAQ